MSSSTLTPLASSAGGPSPPTFSPSSASLAFSSPSSAPTTPYTAYRASALAALRALVDRFQAQAQAQVGEGQMRAWVDEAVKELNDAAGVQDGDERWKKDARQAALARAAEELASSSAIYPPTPSSSAQLTATLDLVLALQEAGHVDELLPLSILTSLMELRPVGGCEELVGYIEARVSRLTKNWDPQRARGPVLLRLLNDLLRRLPRSQSSSVILSGRILLLLSSVFPLGDKSSVNLRGSFNVGKGAVWETQAEREMEGAREDARKEDEEKEKEKEQREDGGKMEVEEGEEAEPGENKGEGNPAKDNPSAFYTLFWSLQRYFTNPPLLFVPQPPSASPESTPFGELKAGLEQTLKAFEAQTRRERELAGGVKEEGARKKTEEEGEGEEEVQAEELEEYFFPKFLTSRNLLDLELASPTFRLQLLVQTLILAQYLLTFTPTSRARLTALPLTNPAAYSSFVLPEETEKWVRELSGRAEEEMGRMEGGEGVRRAVKAVLEREQNWTDWKLRSCPPILRHPSSAPADQSETARKKLKSLGTRPKAYPFRMGNAQLARAWSRNTTSLEECSPSEDAHPSLDALLREHRLESARLKQAEQQAARAAPGSGKRVELEQTAESRRTRLASLSWLIIRLSPSAGHLALLARIGAGDVSKLAELIDEDRRAREAVEEAKEEELERVREGEGEGDGEGEGGEDGGAESDASDQSALGLRREEKERRARVAREREEREERERKEREERAKREREEREKNEREEREREAGTPPPPGGEVEMKDAPLPSASAPSSATATPAGGTPAPAAEEESTTPPPPSRPSASSSSSTPAPTAPPAGREQEEPGTPPPPSGTPPPKSTAPAQGRAQARARLRSPGTPGTPKRLREDDDEGDVEMRDGEGAGGGKKQRVE